ncbi:hypothetical protein PHOBOS_126 [Erwinia phage vB_EamM_Phobos]|uniref:hypothetical protein n=1 Tax=Erwinia phage vB_EamM_Phobos TaxID=1883377 RepID=UPI00081CC28C|nr:hypothetical protein BIZ79_gp126 [Erwinia phage vB_EamM_Phobos]ANZ50316.1 hypothetical protein PHOBOS_126 [Erwinia phage vB_EamM_Phobos]
MENEQPVFPVYNEPSNPEFAIAHQRMYNLAREKQVSYELHYSEVEDSWYVVVSSCAQSENLITKTRSLSLVMDVAIKHLEAL